jgi:hypothetical protein
MAEDLIRYDILAQDALRGVLRKVLSEVAKTGLPGDHHFYIAFATQAPGVRISSRLLAQYPEEVTIVLQHQYWDLTVNEQAFEVGLSFNKVPERLLVPFTAIKAFTDPSVQFELRFDVAERLAPVEPAPEKTTSAKATPLKPVAVKPPTAVPAPAKKKIEAVSPPAPAAEQKDKPAQAAEVVSLDAFRKK